MVKIIQCAPTQRFALLQIFKLHCPLQKSSAVTLSISPKMYHVASSHETDICYIRDMVFDLLNVHLVLDTNVFLQGYKPRQPLYSCHHVRAAVGRNGCSVLGLQSLTCHDGHQLFELYTKRAVCCDCGNSKFANKCTLYAVVHYFLYVDLSRMFFRKSCQ